MPLHQLYSYFSHYNAAINDRLYEVIAKLDDADRTADRNAFFGSIHNTLDHILWADAMWMWRFQAGNRPDGQIGVAQFRDFAALQTARTEMDQRIIAWSESLDDAWLAEMMTWTSADGQTRTQARWRLVSHMFNHQTHHRGQVTALLSQMGIDYGRTDMPWIA